MNILMTGLTGFIGEHLALELIKQGHSILAIIRPSTNISFLEQHSINYLTFIGDVSVLTDNITDQHIDGCIHLASLYLPVHTHNDIEPLISSNILFSTQVLEACVAAKVRWFVNTGTFWQHYNDSEYNPVNLYAATKQAFMTIAEYYIQTSETVFSTLQLSDTYGPGDTRRKVIALWKTCLETQSTLEMSAGEQIIDMCYIDDVVSAFVLLAQSLDNDSTKKYQNSVFGVSNPERVTLKQLASIFEKATQHKLNIHWGIRPYRQREVMKPWSTSTPVPGWKPQISLLEGIKLTVIEGTT